MNKLFIISYPLGYNGTRFSKMLHTSDSFDKRYIHTNICHDLNIQPDEPLRLEAIKLIKEEDSEKEKISCDFGTVVIIYFGDQQI